MEEDVKICPECGAEYFAHVSECRGCEVPLVHPGESAPVERKAPVDSDPLVCIAEGDLGRARALQADLKSAGFDSKVLNMNQGKSCSGGFGVFVNQSLAAQAAGKLQELFYKRNPEVKEMEKKVSEGRCPACGAEIFYSVYECPDCGLNLSGGGHGGGHSHSGGDNCGECGH